MFALLTRKIQIEPKVELRAAEENKFTISIVFLPLCVVAAAGTYIDKPQQLCLADRQKHDAILADLFFSVMPNSCCIEGRI